jgi:glycosyltransferase involved in cell wall biosynthesis
MTPRGPTALVFADRGGSTIAPRTLRALAASGVDAADRSRAPADALAAELRAAADPVWLLRAGAYGLAAPAPALGPSGTGLPLCALGAQVDDERWRAALTATGGDLGALPDEAFAALPLVSAWLDAAAARLLGGALAASPSLGAALASLRGARRVRVAALDARFDPGVRVVQAITSLQQGGAERVALDLHVALTRRGVGARLCTVDRPARTSFALPDGVVDLSAARYHPDAVARALVAEATAFGADLVHAHLLSTPTVRALAARAMAPVVTVHNARPGWPAALDALAPGDARLLVACSLAAEADLSATDFPRERVRAAWNGVDTAAVARLAAKAPPGEVRRALGVDPRALLLVTVANPRPQKRLDRLPAVLAALDAAGDRTAHLVIVGDRHGRSAPARAAEETLALAVDEAGVAARVHRVDSTDAVATYLAAADVFVSTSAYEGLSLAQLEALSAGLPVVTTDVGGAREVAEVSAAVHLVAGDATPADFAAAVLLAARGRADAAAVRARFDTAAMTDRYARLYRHALRPSGSAVWLVINNLSTGGAQSSARRLLVALAARGVAVRAATLQEEPDRPTAGRRALEAAGVPVLALPPPHAAPAAAAVEALLSAMDDAPPAAVLFWNALVEHKLRLADALVGVRLVDVSPGEMYFAALDRHFAGRRAGADLPVASARDYARRLSALVVKYADEAPRAAALGAPVRVIPNGVALPDATARGSDGRVFVIGTTARIAAQKKLEQLVEALAHAAPRLPPHVLRIAGGVEAGSDAYAEALRARCAGLCVEWAGERADVGGFLDGIDLFAMVSEPEGCPNASLEAMAAGLALVVTDAGGAREQVEHGVNGLVTPRGDAAALGDALVAMAVDPARRRDFGRASRARAEGRFSLARMADDYARALFE